MLRMGDYGPCDFDFRHMFTYSTLYELPFGRGMKFGSNVRGLSNAIIGGWNLSGILTLDTGSPFTVVISSDNANVGVGGQRPEQVGNPLPSGFHQTVSHWYNTSAFQVPAPYTYGNVGRNTLRGPGTVDFDMSIYKDFDITESKRLQFRTDLFNLPNHPLFAPPGSGGGNRFGIQGGSASDCLDCGTAGEILGAGPGREIQFSLRLSW